MRKTSMILFVMAISFLASSCAHHKDGSSVWADYLWVIPTVLILSGVYSVFIRAVKQKNSGSTIDNRSGGGKLEDAPNMSLLSIPAFWFGVALIIIGLGVIWGVNFWK